MSQQLLIQNGNTVYEPVVQDEITWTTERKGAAGKLEFKVDNTNLFYGFVFRKKRDKEQIITTTAYDQLRYLKNKDTRVYVNKRADEVVRSIASDFQLNCRNA